MTHKERCNELKKIRKEMADKAGIDLHQTECTFQGECKGTCPKCEAEEKTLNKLLLGGKVALAGAAVGVLSLTACSSDTSVSHIERPEGATRQQSSRNNRSERNNSSGSSFLSRLLHQDDPDELTGDVPAPIDEIYIEEGDVAMPIDDVLMGELPYDPEEDN